MKNLILIIFAVVTAICIILATHFAIALSKPTMFAIVAFATLVFILTIRSIVANSNRKASSYILSQLDDITASYTNQLNQKNRELSSLTAKHAEEIDIQLRNRSAAIKEIERLNEVILDLNNKNSLQYRNLIQLVEEKNEIIKDLKDKLQTAALGTKEQALASIITNGISDEMEANDDPCTFCENEGESYCPKTRHEEVVHPCPRFCIFSDPTE